MAAYLYDQPIDYFRHGCTTNGKFDPKKAAALGYSPAQFPAIKEALADDSPEKDHQTAPLPEIEEKEG